MVEVITESDMDFVADNVFHIEKSSLHSRMSGIRTVEFIRRMEEGLLFVEARTTFANPYNPAADNYVKFQTEIDEIRDKFIHSLNMYASVVLGINSESLPESFSPPDRVSLVFVLVIKTHKLEWCKPISAGILEALPSYIKKIWKPIVQVINHEKAIQQHLAD
jgi:hypothetical protein